jgi:hypothetical protein
MSLKRRRDVGLVGIVGLVAVLLTTSWTVLADYHYEQRIIWTPPEQEDSIAGAWFCSWPGLTELGITEPLKMQQTLMPLGLSDNRLLVRETDFNSAAPPGVEGAIFKRELYNYTTVLKYNILKVHRGQTGSETIYVGHYNPFKPRSEAADKRVPGIGGNLKSFRSGQIHRMALQMPIDDYFMGGIINKYFGTFDGPIYWAVWTNEVPK